MNKITLIIIIVLNFPKINFVNLPGFEQGLRLDDIFAVYCLGCLVLAQKYKVPKVFIVIICVIALSQILSTFLFTGNDLLRIIYLVRTIEYFCIGLFFYNLRSSLQYKKIIFYTISIQLLLILWQYYILGKARPFGSFGGPWEVIVVSGLLLNSGIILYRYNLLFIVMSILTRSRNAIFASVLTTLFVFRKSIFFISLFVPLTLFLVFYSSQQIDWLAKAYQGTILISFLFL